MERLREKTLTEKHTATLKLKNKCLCDSTLTDRHTNGHDFLTTSNPLRKGMVAYHMFNPYDSKFITQTIKNTIKKANSIPL